MQLSPYSSHQVITKKTFIPFHFSTIIKFTSMFLIIEDSVKHSNTGIILSKLFIVPITIKLDKIDTDLSRHCNSPSALLQLTEQHIVYRIILSKINKKCMRIAQK